MGLSTKTVSQLLIVLCIIINTSFGQIDEHDHDHDEHEEHSDLDDIFATTDDHDHDDHDDHDHENGNAGLAFLITCFAGLAAFVGCFSIFCINKQAMTVIPVSLSFAAGVIIYLLFMSLLPASIEQFNESNNDENPALAHFYATLCVISGLIIMSGLEILMKRLGIHSHGVAHGNTNINGNQNGHQKMRPIKSHTNNVGNINIEDDEDEDEDSDSEDNNIQEMRTTAIDAKPTNLRHLSFTVAGALVLHHLPEGIATFISLYYDLEFGILVAFGLAIHDIPGGICIAIPSYLAYGKKRFPFMLCGVAGLTYPLGALIGWIVVTKASESLTQEFIAALFGITAGIMLYVAFIELLPTAIISAHRLSSLNPKNDHGGKCSQNIFGWCIILLFIGFLVMDISSIILAASGGHSH